MFFDLHQQITNSIGNDKASKIAYLGSKKQTAICAIGGFPVVEVNGEFN